MQEFKLHSNTNGNRNSSRTAMPMPTAIPEALTDDGNASGYRVSATPTGTGIQTAVTGNGNGNRKTNSRSAY
jgi:hypothetical protein